MNCCLVNIDNAEEVAGRITYSTTTNPASDKNLLVIEAIPELIEPKQKIFQALSYVLLKCEIILEFRKLITKLNKYFAKSIFYLFYCKNLHFKYSL